MKVVLIGLNSKFSDSNLALYYLRETLVEIADIEVELLELTVNIPLIENLTAILRQEGDVLAFSAYIWNREMLQKLLPLIRKLKQECIIVLGGPEATHSPEGFPEADAILRGAGEVLWPKLIRGLAEGAQVADMGWLKENALSFSKDWPFPYRTEDKERLKNRLVYYETGRGCPFSCSFCLSAAEKRTAFRTSMQVKEDIDRLLTMDCKTIKFVDRTFNYPPQRCNEILSYLLEKARPGVTFHFEIKGDLLNDETIALMQSAPTGYFQVEIGLQSVNPTTLHAVGRNNDWEKINRNVPRLLEKNNLHLHLDLIAGLPHEDLASFKKSFACAWALKPHHLQLGFLKLLPGTPLAANADDHGYITLSHPPYEVLANRYLPYEDMEKIRKAEAVLDREYNSGRHPLSLACATEMFQGHAFDFFLALSKEASLLEGLARLAPQEPGFWDALLRYEDFLLHKQNATSEQEKSAALAFLREEANIQGYLPHLGKERPQAIFKKIRLIHSPFRFQVKNGILKACKQEDCTYVFDYSQIRGVLGHPTAHLI